jgi:hypothetical protein
MVCAGAGGLLPSVWFVPTLGSGHPDERSGVSPKTPERGGRQHFGEATPQRQTLLDRAIEVADGGEVLHLGDDVAFGHRGQRLVHGRVNAFGPFERHALRALEEDEVLEGRLAEGHQCQVHSRRIVVRGSPAGSAGSGGAPRRSRRACSARARGAASHRWRRGRSCAPAGDGVELLGREPFLRALLERERREQVLAHEPVLELGGLAEHVDERLALEGVSTHAEAIPHRLDADTMPCDGAWPAERVAVARRWIDAGKPA